MRKMGVWAMVLGCALPLAAQGYHVVDTWKIGGQGGWDYLTSDDAAHRLYVTHNARVEVIDSNNGEVIGAITGLKSTHGVALNKDGKTGYISDGAGNAIVVFDRGSLQTIATVPAGTNPDGIVYEPKTNTVWAFNGRSKDASVLDAGTNKIVATIPLPGKPEFPQADGQGTVFVNIEDKNEIMKLDARSRTAVATWPLENCDSPSGLAIDRAHKHLFAVCDGKKMAVVDYTSGKTIANPAIGQGPDAAGYDAKRGLAFSSNGEGTLTIVEANKPGFPVLETVKTARGARTMAWDEATGKVFVVTAEFGPAPEATEAMPHPRPRPLPDSFEVLVIGK